ncbi:MAG: serine hydrolase [Verrucomicrobia bacterium]|nr:serine hydrolase [Verrucomicrobiota bacterium]
MVKNIRRLFVGASLLANQWTTGSRASSLLHFKSSIAVCALLVLASLVQASDRDLVQVPPAQIGLSEDALIEITKYLQSQVDDGVVTAAVGMVARHGQIGYFESVGECDTGSLFRLASMTKAVTSVAVMQLVEEGSIKLKDPVSLYFPSFASLKVLGEDGVTLTDVAAEPTIHHLLTHTSGIGYGWFGIPQDAFYQKAGVHDLLVPNIDTLEEHTDKLSQLPLAFQPGEQWMYGQSIDVLGRVIEVVSGLTLQQYFHERIFRPLKMENTRFYVNEVQQKRLVPLYSPDENGGLVKVGSEILSAGSINYSADLSNEGQGKLYAGGSGLVGSTLDYMRFLQMLLNKGSLEGVKILDESTVDLMTQNHIGELSVPFPGHGDGFGYGFGVLTERGKADDLASVGTYSWGGIFNTYYWVDPQEELIGLVMTQIFPNAHVTIREDFKKRVYGAIDDSGFVRRYWYEQGEEHGNPYFNRRQLRVNSAGIGVHPRHATRTETQSSGAMRILIEEDLRSIDGANLYCEIWGGHPGTSHKRVSINGRQKISIPENGTAYDNCTHLYPTFNLAPTDLVNGYNTLQFACDKPGLEWGHFIVENAALDVRLSRDHPDLQSRGLGSFEATVSANTQGETILFEIESNQLEAVSEVVYQARYYGYDENGNGFETDWHGMTKERKPYGMLGAGRGKTHRLEWDLSMLPAQTQIEVKATVSFQDHPNLHFQAAKVGGLEVAPRENVEVSLFSSKDLPNPFWSRVNRKKACTINIDIDPSDIEQADLHVISWTGGAGEVKEYFQLNGHFIPVAEGSGHEVEYSVTSIDPSWLKKGENRFELVSDTEHHGIEILLPGPALMIRSRNR